jgi:transketolase N-terminal domain/subunit
LPSLVDSPFVSASGAGVGLGWRRQRRKRGGVRVYIFIGDGEVGDWAVKAAVGWAYDGLNGLTIEGANCT